jgi:hypothetical protein
LSGIAVVLHLAMIVDVLTSALLRRRTDGESHQVRRLEPRARRLAAQYDTARRLLSCRRPLRRNEDDELVEVD